MKREKWKQIIQTEFNKCGTLEEPEEWPRFKQEVENFMKEAEKATEVFNMENKGVSNGKQS